MENSSSIIQENHQQRLQRRRSLITKLPRQPEMDDYSTSPPLEPRKARLAALSARAPTTPSRTRFAACMDISPVERRSLSPRSPRDMDDQRRTSPLMGSPLSTTPPAAPSNVDPSEDESIALARALMAEEAMESYAMSAEILRYNAAQYSQEDLQALQAAIDDEDSDEEGGDDGGEQYEMLLRLGEAVGDVKTERWNMVSENHIANLPTFMFVKKDVKELDENDSKCKCMVCQFSYDEGETLRKLPCGHCFHAECVDQWLKDKDCCAYCRQPIVVS